MQQGNHEAFAEMVHRHSNRFYRIAYRIVSSKNDAEDVVQEAFLKIWQRPRLWDSHKGAKFTTWFYKVVINLCIDHNKKKRPLALHEGLEVADQKPGLDELVDKQDRQMLLETLIHELPERQQLALNLCFYEGLSNKVAAEILGVTVKALQSLIMHAKTTLKKKVKRHVDGGSI
jgi:RNA polymerase sigma-70 factor (ECF subfamily)